jgi:DNA-binding MarR family transcriptional regulator
MQNDIQQKYTLLGAIRKSHPTDTRAKQIVNTKYGEETFEAVNPIIEAVDQDFFF